MYPRKINLAMLCRVQSVSMLWKLEDGVCGNLSWGQFSDIGIKSNDAHLSHFIKEMGDVRSKK